MLEAGGHQSAAHTIVRDDAAAIEQQLQDWINQPDIDVILTTGGTGFAKRDGTIDVVSRLIDVPIDGFGELFRMISYEQVGAAAMLSRAMAGLVRGKGGDTDSTGTFIFALPGSVHAIRTAMEKLIVPELAHLVMPRRA